MVNEPEQQLTDANLYATIQERGYVLKAYYGERSMVVVAYQDGQEVARQVCPPYMHEPRFGLDVEDYDVLEQQTQLLMERLAQ